MASKAALRFAARFIRTSETRAFPATAKETRTILPAINSAISWMFTLTSKAERDGEQPPVGESSGAV